MVRFSDLLGGSGDPEDARPTAVSTPLPLVTDPEPTEEEKEEEIPEPPLDATFPTAIESPQDVLDRLTQYATSARAGDPSPDAPAPAPDTDPPAEALTPAETIEHFKPVGDDLLPRSGTTRKSGRKRR